MPMPASLLIHSAFSNSAFHKYECTVAGVVHLSEDLLVEPTCTHLARESLSELRVLGMAYQAAGHRFC